MTEHMSGRRTRAARTALAAGAIAGLALFAACGDDDPVGPSGGTVPTGGADEYQAAVETILLSEVRGHVGVLAHDSMAGRWSPSAQLESAARYIASEFSRAGIRPGLPSGYLQWFEIGNAQVLPGTDPAGNLVPGNPGGSGASPNVIGWIEGSDPALRDEHVVFTAHFDHIGTSPVASPTGDYTYNGAAANASGTAALIEIAEASAALAEPPARSLVFVATSGEERGLLGAHHYAANPVLPLASALANINLDMIGRNDPTSVQVIHRTDSDLGELTQAVAALHEDIGVSPVDRPDNVLVQRFDCWAFLSRGVDARFLHSGLHEDYHGLDDEVDLIDSDKAAAVARLAWWVGLEPLR